MNPLIPTILKETVNPFEWLESAATRYSSAGESNILYPRNGTLQFYVGHFTSHQYLECFTAVCLKFSCSTKVCLNVLDSNAKEFNALCLDVH